MVIRKVKVTDLGAYLEQLNANFVKQNNCKKYAYLWRMDFHREVSEFKVDGKGKDKVHPCIITEALYRKYGP